MTTIKWAGWNDYQLVSEPLARRLIKVARIGYTQQSRIFRQLTRRRYSIISQGTWRLVKSDLPLPDMTEEEILKMLAL